MKHAVHLYDAATDNYIGTATAPSPRFRSGVPGDITGPGYSYTTRLTLPRGLTSKERLQAAAAAEHTMRWRCHCAHDCCGHSFGVSRAQIINARTLSVLTRVNYNV